MYNIALICQNGASTGMFAAAMKNAAKEKGIDISIEAYPDNQVGEFIKQKDLILIGPQIAFKKDSILKKFPEEAYKFRNIDSMDFGFMNGKKVLEESLEYLEKDCK